MSKTPQNNKLKFEFESAPAEDSASGDDDFETMTEISEFLNYQNIVLSDTMTQTTSSLNSLKADILALKQQLAQCKDSKKLTPCCDKVIRRADEFCSHQS